MAAADLAPSTRRHTNMDERRIAVVMEELSPSINKINEEYFSKMMTIISENRKQMNKLIEQCLAVVNNGAGDAYSHEDNLSVPEHSYNAVPDNDCNCDDNAEIDETDVVVLKEAIESAEQKNTKASIIAPELFDTGNPTSFNLNFSHKLPKFELYTTIASEMFDENPKKNGSRYFVWCKISDEQRKVLDCVHDTYKLDLEGNDLVCNSRIVSTFGAFPRVKLKFNVLFTNKITTGLKIIIKYSIHGPVDHKLVDKSPNKAVPMFWTVIDAGTSSSMVTPHLFNIIQCLVETAAYKTLNNADEEMMEYVNQQRRSIFEADDVFEMIMKNVARLDSVIIYDRDFDYDYFGFKTLERSYLLKIEGKVVERPQHMLMRVSVGIHKDDIDSAIQTYHLMSQRWFTHASPNTTCNALDYIKASQMIEDGQTIVSALGEIEMGFFSPGKDSKHRYFGIWYNKISKRTVVWVANRDKPVTDTSGVIKVSSNGIVVLANETKVWSSRSVDNPIAQLLDTGNLVFRDENKSGPEDIVWQSFDYTGGGDSILPGMKLGIDLVTSMQWSYTSWKNEDDPSPGRFEYRIDPNAYIPDFHLEDKVLSEGVGNDTAYASQDNGLDSVVAQMLSTQDNKPKG